MSYAPPPGPPPPSIPQGWKAQYDGNHKEWFYVNLNTGVSQWDAPSKDVFNAPDDPPPAYEQSGTTSPAVSGDVKISLASNNPYIQPEIISNSRGNSTNKGGGNSTNNIEDDARLAAQLQAEEDARAVSPHRTSGSCKANASGSTGPDRAVLPEPSAPSPMPSQDQQRGKSSGGFLSRLLGRSSSSKQSGQHDQYSHLQGGGSRLQQSGQSQFNGSGSHTAGYFPGAGGYGGGGGYSAPAAAPSQGYPGGGGGYVAPSAAPSQGYPGGGGGYYSQAGSGSGGGFKSKSGIGTAGALALGAGGGLLGGALLGAALEDEFGHDHAYDDGYQDGAYDASYDDGFNDGSYDGGDYGGDYGDF